MDSRNNDNNASLLFYEDVKIKKLAARGAAHRASRLKGFKGHIRLTHDHLSITKLRELNGEVVKYNMYDDIIPYADFKQLSRVEQKAALNHWINVKKYSRQQISEVWGTRLQSVHDWISRLGLSKSNRAGKKPVSGGTETMDKEARVAPHAPHPMATVLELRMSGEMSGAELRDKITRVDQLISEEQTYIVVIEFKELKKKGS